MEVAPACRDTAGTTGALPTEAQEQAVLVDYLKLLGLAFAHVPNGERRDAVTGARLKRLGTSAGMPDLLVFSSPPKRPDARGVALELKRRSGGKVTPEQRAWHARLEACGWVVRVVRGFDEARALLDELGWVPAQRKRLLGGAEGGAA